MGISKRRNRRGYLALIYIFLMSISKYTYAINKQPNSHGEKTRRSPAMMVQERVRMCRIIYQMECNPQLGKRLGLENKSTFHGHYVKENRPLGTDTNGTQICP